MIDVSCLAAANTISKWQMINCFQGAPWLSVAMATVAETAEPMFTSFQPVRLFISSPLWSFCLTTRSGLRDITSDTPTASSGENHVTAVLLCGWLVCVNAVCLPVWPSILIRSGSPQDRLQEWIKMDGWGQKNDLYPHNGRNGKHIYNVTYITENCSCSNYKYRNILWCQSLMISGAAAARSDLGQRLSVHPAGYRHWYIWARCRLSGFF